MENRFDVVIFGASGYTGKYAVREAVSILRDRKWAIAGRNRTKLEKTLRDTEIFMNIDLSGVAVLIADVHDEKSLEAMTAQANVIVNCCGPYRFYGEAVVKACVATSTSHVDVSGEPQYMEMMQLKYNEAAKAKGIFIVSACGFDSIPADLGVVFLQQKFSGTVNSIEIYLRAFYPDNYEPEGAGVHFATFESAVHGFVHANELRAVRKELFKTRLPRREPKLEQKPKLHRNIDNRWSLSIPSADHAVIARSQRHFYEHERMRPAQVISYNAFESLASALKTIAAGVVLKRLTETECGRDLLLRYPKLFSFGFASREGPSEERNAKTTFETLLIARGWTRKISESDEVITEPQDKTMMARVVCKNPLYGAASTAVLAAAVTILEERHAMPFGGGVLPPGAAFKHTRMIERLRKRGIVFEIVKRDVLRAKL